MTSDYLAAWNLSASVMKPGVLGPAWWFKKVLGCEGFAEKRVAGISSTKQDKVLVNKRFDLL